MKKPALLLAPSLIALIISLPLWANVPAPPTNQTIGVNDGVFNDLLETDCRFCHENPDQFPVEDVTIAVRHHLLNDTVIPNPTDAPYGTPGEVFVCTSCHALDSSGGIISFLVETNCLVCHIQASFFELTVHHRTDLAMGNLLQGPDCKACHGSLVDNMEDGHTIPMYEPSSETPLPSGGTGLPLNSEGNGAGACDYCHSTGTGDPTIQGIDASTGITVYSNEDTHHETGFWGGVGAHGFVCSWCHNFNLPENEQIRVCENCHGPDSLHSIAVDADGSGEVIIGGEPAGYSHVGHDDDCSGCHGYTTASAVPGSGQITPYITSSDISIIPSGVETLLTITGSAFTNLEGSTQWTSQLLLEAEDGSLTELIPQIISAETLTVILPATLPVGNYTLRAVKGSSTSNPVVISIIPRVAISTISCNEVEGVLTITGSGFGDTPPDGAWEYLNVKLSDLPIETISWTDTEILTAVSNCRGTETIDVTALYGSASSASVCDCEGNFDMDSDIDGSDAATFKIDFGRSSLNNPCTNTKSCNGDFDCDEDVDGTDAALFKEDFGRNPFHNPCSPCIVGEWCSY